MDSAFYLARSRDCLLAIELFIFYRAIFRLDGRPSLSWLVSSAQKPTQSPKAISSEGHDDHCVDGCKRNRHAWRIREFPFEMGCGSKTRDLLERRTVKLSRLSMLWLPDQSLFEGTPAEVRQLLADNVKDPTPES